MSIAIVFIFVISTLSLKVEDFFDPKPMKNIKKSENYPFLHPFGSLYDLQEESKKDPLGFSTENYILSIKEYQELTESGNLRTSDFPLHPVGESFYVFDEKSGKNTSLTYSGNHFPGTVNLDLEDDVLDIECKTRDRVMITTGHIDILQQIVPGTRVHFGFEKWPKCPGNIAERYNIVIRRSDFVEKSNGVLTLTYEVQGLGFHEFFHNMKLEFEHYPTKPHTHSDRRQSIDTRESFMFFGYNYDKDSHSCKDPSITLYQDAYNRVSCENCYAYLDSGIILKVDTDWLSIVDFKVGIYGKTEANFGLKYHFGFHWSKTWDFKIFEYKFPAIKFMIGYVPIYIAPAIQLNVDPSFQIDATLELASNVYFTDYAEYTLNYDGSKIFSASQVDPPTFKYDLPHIEPGATRGSVDANAKIIPKVLLYIYSVAPVVLTGTPTVYFHGEVDTTHMEYDTSYSLDLELGLDPLVVPESIPDIGGKTYDFNGMLPWSKTWNLYPKTELTCPYCRGEIDF